MCKNKDCRKCVIVNGKYKIKRFQRFIVLSRDETAFALLENFYEGVQRRGGLNTAKNAPVGSVEKTGGKRQSRTRRDAI